MSYKTFSLRSALPWIGLGWYVLFSIEVINLLDYLAAAPYVKAQDTDEPILLWRPGAVHRTKMYKLGDMDKPDWTTNLKKYQTKVLLTYGSQSFVKYPDEYAQRVADFCGDAAIVKINDIGHNMSSKKQALEAWLPHA